MLHLRRKSRHSRFLPKKFYNINDRSKLQKTLIWIIEECDSKAVAFLSSTLVSTRRTLAYVKKQKCRLRPPPVWPDWAIYCTLGNFSKPLAAINLPKSPTFLGNFCKGVKILFYLYLATLYWSYWLITLTGHTVSYLLPVPLFLCSFESRDETRMFCSAETRRER